MIVLLFTFWGTSILFTIVVIPVYIPTDSVQESKISTALPILAVIFWVFKNTIAIPTCVRWYHIVILICISLINSEVEHFSHTGGHLYVLLREMSVQVLGWILKSGLFLWLVLFLLVQFSSVAQLCPTLCNPMDCSMPGLPVHHPLQEFTQTHVHRVGDAIQPSHPLLAPSPPTFHLSQHQGLFQWVSSLYQVAKVLEFQLQHQSFQWIFRNDFL